MFWPFGIVALNFFIAGVLLFMLGVRSRDGLELSSLWGLRTKRTMVDAETFAKANRAIWRTYIFQGYLSLICGIAILAVGLINNEAYALLAIIALANTLIILIAAIYGYFKGHQSIR